MPITQARMLAVLSAAHNYRNALDQARKIITSASELVEAGHQTTQNYYDLTTLEILSPTLIKDQGKSDAAIDAESQYFSSSRQRANKIAAAKATAKRSSLGTPTRNTSRNQPFKIIEDDPYPPISIPQSKSNDLSYEEAYPEMQTHCIVCMKPLDSPYCGLAPELVKECPKGKTNNPNPSII